MTRIGITQRVEVVEEYDERRDCLDQRWIELVESFGYIPIPLPNSITNVPSYLDMLSIDGLILTGGNDFSHLPDASNAAPERDSFEREALGYALEADVPVLGVCRGLQLLNVHFGGSLTRIEKHVAREHQITFESGPEFMPSDEISVTSYHSYGIGESEIAEPLTVLGRASDGSIECVRHPDHPVFGVMWHPERESPLPETDKRLLKHLFGEIE